VRANALWVAALALCSACAQAHDSWLSPARQAPEAGRVALELATGNRYPLQEFSQSRTSVAQAECVDAGGRRVALQATREQSRWLDLQAQLADPADAPIACWVELYAAEVDIAPPIVQVYFRDIQASPAIRAAWAGLQARTVPWHERYRKFARIELPAAVAVAAGALAQARRPVGLDLEIVVLGDQPIATGQPQRFQVLRDGRPLADLPIELVSERSPVGVWRRSDTEGIVECVLPFPGRWLLRATDLRPAPDNPDTWASRFVTLAIEAR
jgi:uncharacterized GH25 family protein